MVRFHHAVAPGGTGAATVAGDDPPRDHREADRDHGEHRVHRLEGEVARVVTPDVPDARDPDIDGPRAEGPEDEGFAAEHGATVAVASAALSRAVHLTGQSSQGDHVPETITEEQFRHEAKAFLEANAKPRQVERG